MVENAGERRVASARELGAILGERGVRAVAITMVDNAGVARVKTFPVAAIERAARWGIGLSPVFNVFLVNDAITASESIGGPTGDLRLFFDPGALRLLAAQEGWAWAPADQYTQEGAVFPSCQRSFARRMVERAAAAGFELRAGFEVEWFLGRGQEGAVVSAHAGPAYGLAVLAELSDYARDLLDACAASGMSVEQFHPEYGLGQLEISLSPSDPVAACDGNVFVRQTIRAVSVRHGWRASFSPVVLAGAVGNGGHLHLSLWSDGRNLMAGGSGPHGMTDTGEAFVAGILDELPALLAIGAPSVASYLRLVPSRWAGVYACWGRENREAAVRFIAGAAGTREDAANVEVKCFDQAANPYLVMGATIAAGLAGVEQRKKLPAEFPDNPVDHQAEDLEQAGVRRLPQSLGESIAQLEGSPLLRDSMGEVLFDALVAVRRAELAAYGQQSPDAVVAAHRWRY